MICPHCNKEIHEPETPIFFHYKRFCKSIGVSYWLGLSSRRTADIVNIKRSYIHYAYPQYNLRELGELFGLDHSTVIHHRDTHKELIKQDSGYKEKYHV